MIDQEVENLAREFVAKIKSIAPSSFAYDMDESILSLSVLDLYFDERFYKVSEEEKLKDILIASAYAGICIYKIYYGFMEQANLTLSQSKEARITLKLTGGPFINKEPVSINILNVLLRTLLEQPDRIAYIKEEKIPSGMFYRKFSYVIAGILSGMHPSFTGPWTDKSEEELSPYLSYMCKTLAEQSSVIFMSRLPELNDILGPEIFFPHLVFPPIGYQEEYVGARASIAILHTLDKHKNPSQSLKQLSSILIESSDPLLCSLGFIFSSALMQRQDKSTLYLISELFPFLSSKLYPAIQFTRSHYNMPESWHALAKTEQYDEAKALLQHDQSIGLFPLLLCPDQSLMLHPRYRLYFETICSLMLKEAHHLGRIFYQIKDTPLSIRIQHAFISLSVGEVDECQDILKDLKVMGQSHIDKWYALFLEATISSLSVKTTESGLEEIPGIELQTLRHIHNPQVRTNALNLNYNKIDSEQDKWSFLKNNMEYLDCRLIYELLLLQDTFSDDLVTDDRLSSYRRLSISPFYFNSKKPNG